jgi:pimeloyl-ACP methyl ester carboxylesterase
MLNYPIERRLPLITDPVLIVRGQLDTIVSLQWAEECARLLPNGRLVNLPGAAHTTNYSHPLELARVSRPFLTRDRPATLPEGDR